MALDVIVIFVQVGAFDAAASSSASQHAVTGHHFSSVADSQPFPCSFHEPARCSTRGYHEPPRRSPCSYHEPCLLYTSDAADE